MRIIVSTVGTSILTNQIEIGDPGEATWRNMLNTSANLTEKELEHDTQVVIGELATRASDILSTGNAADHCRASAELNGIYGIYGGVLPDNTNDLHYLICTDTAQGQKTGELIKNFLETKGFAVEIFKPPGLSAKDTGSFTAGVKSLIKWLEDNMSEQRHADYSVIFNLVGGFKALQGYMQTFGAFYADEVVYLFEKSSDLIRIPRLPIKIDTDVSQKYRKEFASMASGESYPREELSNIPETLLEFLEEDNDKTDTGLSAWGLLLWNRTKDGLLAADTEVIKEYRIQFALLDAGESLKKSFLRWDGPPRERPDLHLVCTTIDEALLEFPEKSGETYVEMSTWGKLVWEATKSDLLSSEPLLQFPRLQYNGDFLGDVGGHPNKLFDLQETLAKVSVALQDTGGDTSPLKLNKQISGHKFEQLKGFDKICTFRINKNFRVSYEVNNGRLMLRRYGTHKYVYRQP